MSIYLELIELKAEVKELKSYIESLAGSTKRELSASIESLNKDVGQVKVYNKAKLIEIEGNAKQLKKELKSDSVSILKKIDSYELEIAIALQGVKGDTAKQIVYNNKYNAELIESKVKSIVNKNYINDIYRNK
jgi:hypothetical protein